MAKEQEKDHDYFGHVEKALGEPVFFEPNPQTIKIKTQLLVMSVLSIIIVYFQLRIGESSSIFGLIIDNLNDDVVHSGLFGIILYLLGSFFWSSIDGLGEWRLRITGSNVAFQVVSTLADDHSDYPKDPRQSTLYNWWKEEAKKIGHIGDQAAEVIERLNKSRMEIQDVMQNGSHYEKQYGASLLDKLSDIDKALDELKVQVTRCTKTFESIRIPVSLKRFDDWFYYFLKSQNIRWFILDFSLPLILGIIAVISLYRTL